MNKWVVFDCSGSDCGRDNEYMHPVTDIERVILHTDSDITDFVFGSVVYHVRDDMGTYNEFREFLCDNTQTIFYVESVPVTVEHK